MSNKTKLFNELRSISNISEYYSGQFIYKLDSDLLSLSHSDNPIKNDFIPDLIGAFGTNGIVALAFAIGSIFKKEIMAIDHHYQFLEITGKEKTGKTILIDFLCRIAGGCKYSDFNYYKSTDKIFDGDINNFPSLIISNRTCAKGINAELKPRLMNRTVFINLNNFNQSEENKKCAENLEGFDIESINNFFIDVFEKKEETLTLLALNKSIYENRLRKKSSLTNNLLVKNCSHSMALIDALFLVIKSNRKHIEAARSQVLSDAMAVQECLSNKLQG